MPVKCALEELKFEPEFRERQASADGGSDRVLDPGAREEYSSVFYFLIIVEAAYLYGGITYGRGFLFCFVLFFW